MKKKCLIKNEEGYVLIVSLVLLGLLSLIGIAATNTATLEIQIAANSRTYIRNFYKGEAAVREGLNRLLNASADELATWKTPNNIDMKDPEKWTDPGAKPQPSKIMPNEPLFYAVSGPKPMPDESGGGGGSPGGSDASEDMTKSKTLVYFIYGYYNQDNSSLPDRGRVLIDMGYRIKINVK